MHILIGMFWSGTMLEITDLQGLNELVVSGSFGHGLEPAMHP